MRIAILLTRFLSLDRPMSFPQVKSVREVKLIYGGDFLDDAQHVNGLRLPKRDKLNHMGPNLTQIPLLTRARVRWCQIVAANLRSRLGLVGA